MTPGERWRKTEEIRRTGETWQWPDVAEHREWTRGHKVALGWVLLTAACLAWLIWGLVAGYWWGG